MRSSFHRVFHLVGEVYVARKRRLLCVILATCVISATVQAFPVRGIVLGLYAEDPDFDYDRQLEEISAAGANYVLFLVSLPQDTILSPEVGRVDSHQRGVMRHVLAKAGEIGLDTGILPIVALGQIEPGKWRGTLAPPDWKQWFTSYRQAILNIAHISEDGGASLLAVGSELVSSERESAEWSKTIRQVRKVFSGKLLYSANWDHLPEEPFVRELDLLGLNAYWGLVCDGQEASLGVLDDSWDGIAQRSVLPWQGRFRKPILFTEVGYMSAQGMAYHPWDYTLDAEVDTEAQVKLYYAFSRAWANQSSFAGVFFYVWWEGRERDSTGYTPNGKPAGDFLRSWYLAQRRQDRAAIP